MKRQHKTAMLLSTALATVAGLSGCSDSAREDVTTETVNTASEIQLAQTEVSAPVLLSETDPAANNPTASNETSNENFEITPIVGDLYQARSGGHNSVFLVTPEGVIMTDPLNLEFSEWLKAEIAARFDSEVKYVLYSHFHWDHASGGAAFADTAEFIGHANMLTALEQPIPPNYAGADANGDGVLIRDEVGGGLNRAFAAMDLNSDGFMTGEEINVDIISPTTTYSGESKSIYLGGREVQMIYAGNLQSEDATIIYFPEEAFVFAVDWYNVKGFPRILSGTNVDEWIAGVERIANLNPSYVLPGHGEMGTAEDVQAYLSYFKALDLAATNAKALGLSEDAFMELIESDASPLAAYKSWSLADSRMLDNAREAFRMVE